MFLFIGDGMAMSQISSAEVFATARSSKDITVTKLGFTQFPVAGLTGTQYDTFFDKVALQKRSYVQFAAGVFRTTDNTDHADGGKLSEESNTSLIIRGSSKTSDLEELP